MIKNILNLANPANKLGIIKHGAVAAIDAIKSTKAGEDLELDDMPDLDATNTINKIDEFFERWIPRYHIPHQYRLHLRDIPDCDAPECIKERKSWDARIQTPNGMTSKTKKEIHIHKLLRLLAAKEG